MSSRGDEGEAVAVNDETADVACGTPTRRRGVRGADVIAGRRDARARSRSGIHARAPTAIAHARDAEDDMSRAFDGPGVDSKDAGDALWGGREELEVR